jgi:pre-mRNA-splicing factor 38A
VARRTRAQANRTDPSAVTVHGTNPQYLVEKILRTKIYNHPYWKEHCFGLTGARARSSRGARARSRRPSTCLHARVPYRPTLLPPAHALTARVATPRARFLPAAESLLDQAIHLKCVGGTFGGARQPTEFICLVLKMLQISPERDIVLELITNEAHKYVRALAAFYLRLTGSSQDVYAFIEPLFNDYRKLRMRTAEGGYALTHVDEFAAQLLNTDENYACDIALPPLARREQLVASGTLDGPRRSALEDEIEEALAAEAAAAEVAAADAAAKAAAERAVAPPPPPPPPPRPERDDDRRRARSPRRDSPPGGRRVSRSPEWRRGRSPSRSPRRDDRRRHEHDGGGSGRGGVRDGGRGGERAGERQHARSPPRDQRRPYQRSRSRSPDRQAGRGVRYD